MKEVSLFIDPDKEKYSNQGRAIWEEIETQQGSLTRQTRKKDDKYPEIIFLKEIQIASGNNIDFRGVYPEDHGLPQIVVVRYWKDGYDETNEYLKLHIIDVAADPVFFSPDYIPIIIDYDPDWCAYRGCKGVRGKMDIEKVAEGVYDFSGTSFVDRDAKGKPLPVTYRYDRATRSVVKIK